MNGRAISALICPYWFAMHSKTAWEFSNSNKVYNYGVAFVAATAIYCRFGLFCLSFFVSDAILEIIILAHTSNITLLVHTNTETCNMSTSFVAFAAVRAFGLCVSKISQNWNLSFCSLFNPILCSFFSSYFKPYVVNVHTSLAHLSVFHTLTLTHTVSHHHQSHTACVCVRLFCFRFVFVSYFLIFFLAWFDSYSIGKLFAIQCTLESWHSLWLLLLLCSVVRACFTGSVPDLHSYYFPTIFRSVLSASPFSVTHFFFLFRSVSFESFASLVLCMNFCMTPHLTLVCLSLVIWYWCCWSLSFSRVPLSFRSFSLPRWNLFNGIYEWATNKIK